MVKGNRFLSILVTAVILAMLMITIPVISASAETGLENINVVPSNGAVGDSVDVEGTGFEPSDTVYIFFSNEEADEGDDVGDLDSYFEADSALTSSEGDFSGNFDVPDELDDGSEDVAVTGGQYYVYASYDSDGDDIVAIDEFNVIGISISPTRGVVGTRVTVTGAGFDSRKDVEIRFGSTNVTDDIEGDDETSSSGAFTSYFNVPKSTAGKHTITVEVSGDEGEAEFTVEPTIDISPEEGAVNDRVTVTGIGFAYRKDVTITFGGIDVGGETTDSSGSFETQVNVPEVGAGTYEVEAEDESGNSASATFRISTEVSISPTTSVNSPGHVGTEVTISGTGFKPDYEITITYTSTPVEFTTTSEADGSFSYTFEVPPSEAGEHSITASDGTSSMSVNFFMESTPPATPPPLLPYMDGKVKSLAYFDWEDVVADIDGVVEQSLPITYELQIATDENFTKLSLNKKGLTTSEYTLTEDEALEKTSSEIPYYYWRIRAVDAASNASPWTGAGRFTLGFSFDFDLSGWLLYVLIGVGALVLFFVGFWIGRRGGGEYY